MTTDEPRFHYTRTGFVFSVYTNRVEVKERQFLGNIKPTAILLRTITTVEATPAKLTITTMDGTRYTYTLGTRTDAARQAILALLQ